MCSVATFATCCHFLPLEPLLPLLPFLPVIAIFCQLLPVVASCCQEDGCMQWWCGWKDRVEVSAVH